jgi:hypothetical protein
MSDWEQRCDIHGPWPRFEGMCVQCATAATPDSEITCPFCGRLDFDKPGLKSHLDGQCEAMDAVENIRR